MQERVNAHKDEILSKVESAGDKIDEQVTALNNVANPLKAEVLRAQMPELMTGQILGFKFSYATTQPDKRKMVVNQVLTQNEYETHKAFIRKKRMKREELTLDKYLALIGEDAFEFKSIF